MPVVSQRQRLTCSIRIELRPIRVSGWQTATYGKQDTGEAEWAHMDAHTRTLQSPTWKSTTRRTIFSPVSVGLSHGHDWRHRQGQRSHGTSSRQSSRFAKEASEAACQAPHGVHVKETTWRLLRGGECPDFISGDSAFSSAQSMVLARQLEVLATALSLLAVAIYQAQSLSVLDSHQ